MFSKENQAKLRKNGFEVEDAEDNIWILEKGESSVTISGDDESVEAIWQTFEGEFDEITGSMESILEWSENMIGAK
jgi:hypothetical protein